MTQNIDTRYHQYDYEQSMGAKTHKLTSGNALRAKLDERGEYNAEVYDWQVHQLPSDKVKSMDHVEKVVMQLYSTAQALYQQDVTRSEEDVRRHLVEQVQTFKEFTYTHPRIFWLMTAKTVDAAHRMHILNLIALKRNHQERDISIEEQQQEVSTYMQSHFVRPAKPGEEEQAIANGTGIRGEVVDTRKL